VDLDEEVRGLGRGDCDTLDDYRYVLNPTLDRWIVKICISTKSHISYL
jgi:hypothetical protein